MTPEDIKIVEEVRAFSRTSGISVKAIIEKRDDWEQLYHQLRTLCETQEEVIADLRKKLAATKNVDTRMYTTGDTTHAEWKDAK